MFTEKTIWLREEINIADELMAYAPKLLEEFLARHPDFIDGDFSLGIPFQFTTDYKTTLENINTDTAWKVDTLKHTYVEQNSYFNYTDRSQDVIDSYPTAIEMTARYGKDCPISTYSILEKNSIIDRHTGVENRDAEFIRIHIPLLIPEGDIFFEVEGVEIDWSDLFGFDNQMIHAAHNYSNSRRLVYLIDISRKLLGIPNGNPFNPEREKSVLPFKRGRYPKILHTKQRNN